MVLKGYSYAQIMRDQLPMYRTIKRWKAWLKGEFLIHSHVLKVSFSDLNDQSLAIFWSDCWQQMSLAKAMFYVQQDKEAVP